MKNLSPLVALVVTAVFGIAGTAAAQNTAPAAGQSKPAATSEKPDAKAAAKSEKKVYHGGGKHDQRGHEATEQARARGQTMEQPAVHPGGKHDEQGHKAAIKAQERAAKPEEGSAKK